MADDKTEELNDEIKSLKEQVASQEKANKARYAGAVASAAAQELIKNKADKQAKQEIEVVALKKKMKKLQVMGGQFHMAEALACKRILLEKYGQILV